MDLDGKSLERATQLIENHILDHIEKSKIGEIKIETNKIVTVNDVKHEIDVFVNVDLKIGTTLIYIFECKDWETKTVSKNDIIVFSEKINALSAAKGYFVAKRFGKYAVNQVKQDSRIQLLPFEKGKLFDVDTFLHLDTVTVENINITITISPPAFHITNEIQNYPLTLSNGKKTTLTEIIRDKVFTAGFKEDKEVQFHVRNSDYWEFSLSYDNIMVNESILFFLKVLLKVSFKMVPPELIHDFRIENIKKDTM